MANESKEEYDQLLFDYIRLYQPVGTVEQDLVHEIAANRWRLRRCLRLETAAFDKAMAQAAEHCDDPEELDAMVLEITMGKSGVLRQLNRYEARLRRAYERANTELRRIQAERIAAEQPKVAQKNKLQNEPENHVDIWAHAVKHTPEPAQSAALHVMTESEPGSCV